jgi:hypothetical protein
MECLLWVKVRAWARRASCCRPRRPIVTTANIVELIAPQGRLRLIDDRTELSALPLEGKTVSLHWALMFTRSIFGTPYVQRQRQLLNEGAALVDAGRFRSTGTEVAGKIDAAQSADRKRLGARQARVRRLLTGPTCRTTWMPTGVTPSTSVERPIGATKPTRPRAMCRALQMSPSPARSGFSEAAGGHRQDLAESWPPAARRNLTFVVSGLRLQATDSRHRATAGRMRPRSKAVAHRHPVPIDSR